MSDQPFGMVYLRPDKGCKCCGAEDERYAWWHRHTARLFAYERGVWGEWRFDGFGFTRRSARRDAWRKATRKADW